MTLPSPSPTWAVALAGIEVGLVCCALVVGSVLVYKRRQSRLLLARSKTLMAMANCGGLVALYAPIRTLMGWDKESCGAFLSLFYVASFCFLGALAINLARAHALHAMQQEIAVAFLVGDSASDLPSQRSHPRRRTATSDAEAVALTEAMSDVSPPRAAMPSVDRSAHVGLSGEVHSVSSSATGVGTSGSVPTVSEAGTHRGDASDRSGTGTVTPGAGGGGGNTGRRVSTGVGISGQVNSSRRSSQQQREAAAAAAAGYGTGLSSAAIGVASKAGGAFAHQPSSRGILKGASTRNVLEHASATVTQTMMQGGVPQVPPPVHSPAAPLVPRAHSPAASVSPVDASETRPGPVSPVPALHLRASRRGLVGARDSIVSMREGKKSARETGGAKTPPPSLLAKGDGGDGVGYHEGGTPTGTTRDASIDVHVKEGETPHVPLFSLTAGRAASTRNLYRPASVRSLVPAVPPGPSEAVGLSTVASGDGDLSGCPPRHNATPSPTPTAATGATGVLGSRSPSRSPSGHSPSPPIHYVASRSGGGVDQATRDLIASAQVVGETHVPPRMQLALPSTKRLSHQLSGGPVRSIGASHSLGVESGQPQTPGSARAAASGSRVRAATASSPLSALHWAGSGFVSSEYPYVYHHPHGESSLAVSASSVSECMAAPRRTVGQILWMLPLGLYWGLGVVAVLLQLRAQAGGVAGVSACERDGTQVGINAAFVGVFLVALLLALRRLRSAISEAVHLLQEASMLLTMYVCCFVVFFAAYASYLDGGRLHYVIDSSLLAAGILTTYITLIRPAMETYHNPWKPVQESEAQQEHAAHLQELAEAQAREKEHRTAAWVRFVSCGCCGGRSTTRRSSGMSSASARASLASEDNTPAFGRSKVRSSIVVTENRNNKVVLEEILKDTLGRRLLAAHLQRELSLEDLSFILHVTAFRAAVQAAHDAPHDGHSFYATASASAGVSGSLAQSAGQVPNLSASARGSGEGSMQHKSVPILTATTPRTVPRNLHSDIPSKTSPVQVMVGTRVQPLSSDAAPSPASPPHEAVAIADTPGTGSARSVIHKSPLRMALSIYWQYVEAGAPAQVTLSTDATASVQHRLEQCLLAFGDVLPDRRASLSLTALRAATAAYTPGSASARAQLNGSGGVSEVPSILPPTAGSALLHVVGDRGVEKLPLFTDVMGSAQVSAGELAAVSSGIFDDAFLEVYSALLHDSLPRFLLSQAYVLWSAHRPLVSKVVHRKDKPAGPTLLKSLSKRLLAGEGAVPTAASASVGGSGGLNASAPSPRPAGASAQDGGTTPRTHQPHPAALSGTARQASFKRATVVPV